MTLVKSCEKCRSFTKGIWSKKGRFGGRKVGVVMDNQGLDLEWLMLVKQAKKAGLTKEEVRQFLLGKKNGEDLQLEVLEKVN